jgi:AcrR family transcriptional regulator
VIDSVPAPAPLSRRERKKQDARRRIYQAAVRLFIEKGFETTTMDEIAQRADVGKGTVFNYFPHKTSFLAALAEDWTNRVTEVLGPVDHWRGTTRRKLERLFRYLADVGAENPAVSCLALLESLRQVSSGPGPEPPGDHGQVQHFYELTRAILRLGQAHGELRREVSVEHAASLIESGFLCTLARWLLAEDTRRALHQEMAAELDIVLNGLVARGRVPAGRAPSRPPHQRGR